jgi:RNA polymerase primary sigma factor
MATATNTPRKIVSRSANKARRSRRKSPQSPSLEQLRVRAERLCHMPIDFIANATFSDPLVQKEILSQDLEPERATERSSVERKSLRDMPAHLTRLCETELLTADQERALFRRMNFLKYYADQLRNKIDTQRPDMETLELAEQCLTDAAATRDRIVRANMRLVVMIVKKFVSPQLSFDEMLSDGIMTLLNAVEKFDFELGFRFSTYAYRSIARSAYRCVVDRHRENQRFQSAAEDAVAEIAGSAPTAAFDERTWEKLRRLLSSMLDRLDGREQFIVSARYALGKQRHSATFQSIADKLGVSKERVRQLEQRAVNKLRTMAVELQVDELLSPLAG